MTESQEMLCLCAAASRFDARFDKLLSAITERDGNIAQCSLTRHGTAGILTLSISGHWGALSRIEAAIPAMQDSLEMNIHMLRTTAEKTQREFRPYAAELYAPTQAGILPAVMSFFTAADVQIRDLSAQEYRSGVSGGELINLTLILDVPMDLSPQSLRESYMDFCDELRADGVLDPIKA